MIATEKLSLVRSNSVRLTPSIGDRALLYAIAHEIGGDGDPQVRCPGQHFPDRVDVTLQDVTAETVRRLDRSLEVHAVARLEQAEGRAIQGFGGELGLPDPLPRAKAR